MTNQIQTKTFKNPFSNQNYYIIEIDGKSLEDYVLENSDLTEGLVPTLLNWLHDESERKVVWNRVLPKMGETTYLPILMCSEDVDLWCDLIMVEVQADERFVYWNRLGLDDTNADKPEEIGDNILWFDNSPSFRFDKTQYVDVINQFRKYLNIETDVYPAKIGEIVTEG